MNTATSVAADYIEPLVINGLHGRVMHVPSSNHSAKKEILMIYGHHSALERMFGIVQNMAKYGDVTMPDLPGFGGMDSLYTIGEKPTVDTMADYLASFIKLRYKNRRLIIGGMSYGFLITTRCLQKYPAIAKQVDLLVSMVGFTSPDDFKFSPMKYRTYKLVGKVFSGPIGSRLFRYIALQPFIIKSTYRLQASTHPKMKDANKEELAKRLDFEVFLWHCNDARTYMYTGNTLLTTDLTHTKVPVRVAHISVKDDQYFDNAKVKKHLKKIFKYVSLHEAHMPNHAPTVISDAEEAAAFIPASMARVLAHKPAGVK